MVNLALKKKLNLSLCMMMKICRLDLDDELPDRTPY